eukprot:TRINITY_DN2163_c0_g1_i1.p2 TRINITY_DN2163_c0_g1~~TRINITY_DN2163_c0_g1_i1.p2  ORF type:complete len:50 (-),score=7.20 TRINITY_DN2163_c0_g1_i1:151-300(-)
MFFPRTSGFVPHLTATNQISSSGECFLVEGPGRLQSEVQTKSEKKMVRP